MLRRIFLCNNNRVTILYTLRTREASSSENSRFISTGRNRSIHLPRTSRRCGRIWQSASEYICVIITARSARARAIMRVIVWLTKHVQDRTTVVCYYLIDARALSRSLRNDLAHRYPVTTELQARNANGQLVKRAIQRQRRKTERERERTRGKGKKGMHGAKFPSLLLYRARGSLVNAPLKLPLRAEAQIARETSF